MERKNHAKVGFELMIKPRIRLNLRSGKYECKWYVGSWVGFGLTPELAFKHFTQSNCFPFENRFHLAA